MDLIFSSDSSSDETSDDEILLLYAYQKNKQKKRIRSLYSRTCHIGHPYTLATCLHWPASPGTWKMFSIENPLYTLATCLHWPLFLGTEGGQCRQVRLYMDPFNVCRNDRSEFSVLLPDMQSAPEKHYSFFRMSRERFNDLLERVRPFIIQKNTHKKPISAEQRLALTLRILAHGDSQKYISIRDRIGQKTTNVIFNKTCRAIWDALQEFVREPELEDLQHIAKEFWELWNFPNCVGALDGKHIRIKAPRNAGSRYHNFKGFHSIVLLAVCDANYCFSYIDVGDWGKISDGGVLANSQFGQHLADEKVKFPGLKNLPGSDIALPHVLVGDEAFPLRHTIMRPFPGTAKGNVPKNQRIFNYRLSRARRIIENAFGILGARWRILQRPIEAFPENVEAIVLACIALHNYLKKTDANTQAQARYVPPCFIDYEDDHSVLQKGDWRKVPVGTSFQKIKRTSSNNYDEAAYGVRKSFMQYFLTAEGKIPWQDHVVDRGLSQN